MENSPRRFGVRSGSAPLNSLAKLRIHLVFGLVLLSAVLSGLMLPPRSHGHRAVVPETPPNFKMAFIGDQGLGPNSVAVLNLIKTEGAQAVLHSGDLEYTDNPAAWEAQINSVLGADFPYFVTIGNHDELAWKGATGYQQFVTNRFNRLGLSWSGDLGVQSSFHYQGLFFVSTAPGIGSGFDNGSSDTYIRDQLASDSSIWSICSWHKDMKLMQVGLKEDETGWAVYEEARKGGAIIATAHEHSYSRTHLLSNMTSQTIASTSNTLTLTKGNSFAFLSGLGGHSVRAQSLTGPWWASISASTCLAGDSICQPNGNPGALFGTFNVDGQPDKAVFYFKDIAGHVIDSFTVISNVEQPSINSLSPSSATAGGSDFTLTVNGQNFANSAVVRWDNTNLPTTFISSSQLSAAISAADIAAAGLALVSVANPGGTSNAVNFTINPPPILPSINTLSPASATAGGSGFSLIVNGQNFLNTSVVRWNNANRPTTFVSSTQLSAAISAADIGAAGSASVTVSNPDGISNASSFTINAPVLPSIKSLSPASVEAGGNGFALIVNGDNFLNTSVVLWNSVNRPTIFVSSSQLSAAISSADIAAPGAAMITISNPDGPSNAVTFSVASPSIRLFTEENSDRAIALDSVTLVRDPFLPFALHNLSSETQTRIMFFSPNLSLMPGDTFSSITCRAEDLEHKVYPLAVEFVGQTPQFDWLTQIVVRLPAEVGAVNELWVSISYRGSISNKAVIRLKHSGQ
jgi:hypothetical protein